MKALATAQLQVRMIRSSARRLLVCDDFFSDEIPI